MTEKERFKVCNGFDGNNEPIKEIEDTETTEIYSMENELEANSVCIMLNEQDMKINQLKEIVEELSNKLAEHGIFHSFRLSDGSDFMVKE